MSSKITRLLCAAALTVPLLGVAAPADATNRPTYRAPQVAWVSDAKVSGDRASVLARYRCYGGNEGTHLWVSLKQGGGITGKTAEELSQMEGTSALARAWYDTNVVDPATVTLTCNGRWQVQRYTVARHPEKDRLSRGTAFLQFCLFDSTADPTGADLSYGFAYEYKTVKVHTRHHGHR